MIGYGYGYGYSVQQGGLLNVIPLKITSDTEVNNFIKPIVLHKSENSTGKQTGTDVYIGTNFQDDFSDVIFKDGNGNVLESYITNINNLDIQYDDTLPLNSIIVDGVIYGTKIYETVKNLVKSTDNGQTWNIIYNISCDLVSVDSRGYIYLCDNAYHLFKRSIDGGQNWTTVLDMAAVSGEIQTATFTEDSEGNIYIGRYQVSYAPIIYKSIDSGATFTDIFSANSLPARPRNTAVTLGTYVRPTTPNGKIYYCSVAGTTADDVDPVWPTTSNGTVTDGTVTWKESQLQHVHHISVDPFTQKIYATFDGVAALFRSDDGGSSWIKLYNTDARCVVYGDGYRLFGAGAYQYLGNISIYRTTDDITFTPVLANKHSIQSMTVADGKIFAASNSYANGIYPCIYVSKDDGLTWESIEQPHYNTGGVFDGNLLSPFGTLNSINQSIIGINAGTYLNGRLRLGSAFKSALAWVKTSVINGEKVIKIHKSASNSAKSVFPCKVESNLLLRVKFNEGIGTPSESSENEYTTELISGAGAEWSTGGRFVGAVYPKVHQFNKSFKFNGNSVLKVTNYTTSPANTLTAICWYKYVQSTSYQTLMGNLVDFTGWALTILDGIYYLYYGTGAAVKQRNLANGYSVNDGEWHMAGIIIDNSTPNKIKFIHDGLIVGSLFTTSGDWYTLTADVASNNFSFKIGSSGNASMYNQFLGQISDVQLYSGNLTAQQVRSIYEDRPIITNEPTITI